MTQPVSGSFPALAARLVFALFAGASLAGIALQFLPRSAFPFWAALWVFTVAAAAYLALAAGRPIEGARRDAGALILFGILLAAGALLGGALFSDRLGQRIAGVPPLFPLLVFGVCALCVATAQTRDPYGSMLRRMGIAAGAGAVTFANGAGFGVTQTWFLVPSGETAGWILVLTCVMAAAVCAALAMRDAMAPDVQQRIRALHRPGFALAWVNAVFLAGNLARWT